MLNKMERSLLKLVQRYGVVLSVGRGLVLVLMGTASTFVCH